jgi:hypothetical protein
LKNLADEFVGEVASPEAFHEGKCGYPFRESDINGPVVVAVVFCRGGRDLDE